MSLFTLGFYWFSLLITVSISIILFYFWFDIWLNLISRSVGWQWNCSYINIKPEVLCWICFHSSNLVRFFEILLYHCQCLQLYSNYYHLWISQKKSLLKILSDIGTRENQKSMHSRFSDKLFCIIQLYFCNLEWRCYFLAKSPWTHIMLHITIFVDFPVVWILC